MSLKILRHVPELGEDSIKALAGTEPRVPGFPEWLDNEHPRHSFLSEEIAAATTEYAVADATTRHRTFKSLAEAEAARAGAKVTFGVDMVDVPTAKQAEKAAAKADDPE